MDQHVIECVISGIPSQVTGVKWNPAKQFAGSYTLSDGTFGGGSQVEQYDVTPTILNL